MDNFWTRLGFILVRFLEPRANASHSVVIHHKVGAILPKPKADHKEPTMDVEVARCRFSMSQ